MREHKLDVVIFQMWKDEFTFSKGQLTWTFCERLFCSSSFISECPSGHVDSGIFLTVCCRLTAVEKTRCERLVHATAMLRVRPV